MEKLKAFSIKNQTEILMVLTLSILVIAYKVFVPNKK